MTSTERIAPAARAGALAAAPAVALVLAAVNLRPAMGSAGSLLAAIRHGLGLSPTAAGLLGSLPTLCFAVLGTAAPQLVRRAGVRLVLAGAMGAVALGLALRPFLGGTAGFFVLTALAVAGIAISNVSMPIAVRQYFPDRVGPATGLYSTALTAGTALSAAVAVPLSGFLGGWRGGLAVWALPALAAAVAWYLLRPQTTTPGTAASTTAVTTQAPVPRTPATGPWRSPTAWALAVFFGLQAAGAYIALSWVPAIFADAGLSPGTSGLLLALVPAVGVPFAFVLPTVAGRLRRQSEPTVLLAAIGLAAYAGLWLAPGSVPWLWAALLGVSQASFPLALTLIGLRAGRDVAGLSAFVQGVGYLISVPCPAVVGVLVQHTGGWSAPLAFMAALLVPQAIAGALAGRNRTV